LSVKQKILFFFLPKRSLTSYPEGRKKLVQVECKTKDFILFFTETQPKHYLPSSASLQNGDLRFLSQRGEKIVQTEDNTKEKNHFLSFIVEVQPNLNIIKVGDK